MILSRLEGMDEGGPTRTITMVCYVRRWETVWREMENMGGTIGMTSVHTYDLNTVH